MRNTFFLLGLVAVTALLSTGCAGPEQKLGRGFANTTEIVRGGEFDRSVEQAGLFQGPDTGIATGIVEGTSRTLARTGVGVYEIVTFPFPPYHAVARNYLADKPQYPDAYRPRTVSDSIFDNDRYVGFSGGDVAPWFPGSKFSIFDN